MNIVLELWIADLASLSNVFLLTVVVELGVNFFSQLMDGVGVVVIYKLPISIVVREGSNPVCRRSVIIAW